MTYQDLTPDEFLDLLRKGLGRAVLYLQSHDPAPYRDVILHACTHDRRFDSLQGAAHDRFLCDVVVASGEPGFYGPKIVEALRCCEDEDDARHMVSLVDTLLEAGAISKDTVVRAPLILDHMRAAGHPTQDWTQDWAWAVIARRLAAMGDPEARSLLFHLFEQNMATGDTCGAGDIIRLDGVSGFIYVARHLASRDNTAEDLSIQRLWLDELEERDGKAGTVDRVREAMQGEPDLLRWFDAVRNQRYRERHKRSRGRRTSRYSYDEVRLQIEAAISSDKRLLMSSLWEACVASKKTVMRLADDLVTEREPDRTRAFLQLFTNVPFPRDPALLIDLAHHADESMSRRAMRALTLIANDDVRNMTLDLLACAGYTDYSLGVLSANAGEGDHRLVEEVLRRDLDPDTMHRAELDALTFYKDNPDQPCLDGLTILYERGPCSFCRNTVVEMLIKRDLLPEWMREEGRYDSRPVTRVAVQ